MFKYTIVTVALLDNGTHVRTTDLYVRTPTELALAIGDIDDIKFDKYQVIATKDVFEDIVDGD